MVIFPLAPDQTIAQMWSNGARGGYVPHNSGCGSALKMTLETVKQIQYKYFSNMRANKQYRFTSSHVNKEKIRRQTFM